MIIYQNTKAGFINDVDNNDLKRLLVQGFLDKTGSVPSDQYVWADEYARFSLALRQSKIDDDVSVAIEYHISAAGRFRVDVFMAGNNGQTDNGLIIELKAWEQAGLTDIPDMVLSPVGGGTIKQHPCLQARKYKGLILRFNEDIRTNAVELHAAAYLFNLHRRTPEPLEDARYGDILKDSKLFLAEDAGRLREHMEQVVPKKPKQDVLFMVEYGRLKPTEELVARVSSMLEGNEEFELVDEQNEAFNIIRHRILDEKDRTHRHVYVVEGGPGTGKSVIAIRLLAEVLKAKRMGFMVAPNAAFRNTLIEYMAKGNKGYREDGQALLHSSWSFYATDYKKDERFEILIVDEAHRLKGQGAYQYQGKSMVEDMVRAARISVFFIDETQKVSWQDIGTVQSIKDAAKKFKAEFNLLPPLTAQFRCNGSTGYLNWVEDVLQIKETGNYDGWGNGQYEFKVFDRAEELYAALKEKNDQNKARLIAGYSWPWPTKGRERGTKVMHVQADGLALPWNYMGENWATSEDGIGQVGCIHTSQGLEFDWLGVLIGPDLIYRDGKVVGDPAKRAGTDVSLKGWKGALEKAGDDLVAKEAVLQRVQTIIKSTYKVLLSRGRKGCYVWCQDEELREYLKQRLNLAKTVPTSIQEKPKYPFEVFSTAEPGLVPIYSLEAAAGGFSANQTVESLGWVKVTGLSKPTAEHFVAKVVGKSMEPLIKDGSYCLFRRYTGGSREGKVVLAQSTSILDPETSASFTVKKYHSEKIEGPDGVWSHSKIELRSINTDYQSIALIGDMGGGVMVLAEFERVL